MSTVHTARPLQVEDGRRASACARSALPDSDGEVFSKQCSVTSDGKVVGLPIRADSGTPPERVSS
jgi:hypothetical protein